MDISGRPSTFEDKPPPTTPQRSRSHLGRSALAGLIVGCIVGLLLCGVLIIYIMKKKKKGRREKEKNAELPADGEAVLNDRFDSPWYPELSTEQQPNEIMNPTSDRAELSDSWRKPPVELYAH